MRLEPITGRDNLFVGDIVTEGPMGCYYEWKIVSIEDDSVFTVHRIREDGGEFSDRPMEWNISTWIRGNMVKSVGFLPYDPKQQGDTDDDI